MVKKQVPVSFRNRDAKLSCISKWPSTHGYFPCAYIGMVFERSWGFNKGLVWLSVPGFGEFCIGFKGVLRLKFRVYVSGFRFKV